MDDIKLTVQNKILSLINIKDPKTKPIFVDFFSKKLLSRIQKNNLTKEPLIKALGKNKNKALNIIDATAGLGKDSFLLAAATNANVFMIERNKIIEKLLEDGLQRARLECKKDDSKKSEQIKSTSKIKAILSKMHLYYGDAVTIIPKLANKIPIDIIYLDPMFPLSTKSKALPKKNILTLRKIIKEDLDVDKLLQIAIKFAKQKVIVKRAKTSPYISNKKPEHSFIGKSNRLDVYACHSSFC